MARFPKPEAEIVALAQAMVLGLTGNAALYPAPPVLPAALTTLVSAYTTATHVPYPLVMGDINLDGKVDLADFGLMSGNYGKQIDLSDPNSHPWRSGDLNLNGRVDLVDLGIFSANYR